MACQMPVTLVKSCWNWQVQRDSRVYAKYLTFTLIPQEEWHVVFIYFYSVFFLLIRSTVHPAIILFSLMSEQPVLIKFERYLV